MLSGCKGPRPAAVAEYRNSFVEIFVCTHNVFIREHTRTPEREQGLCLLGADSKCLGRQCEM